eukprot:c18059_g1_i2 orf=796-1569(-)
MGHEVSVLTNALCCNGALKNLRFPEFGNTSSSSSVVQYRKESNTAASTLLLPSIHSVAGEEILPMKVQAEQFCYPSFDLTYVQDFGSVAAVNLSYVATEGGLSESGWTSYFNLSSDDCATHANLFLDVASLGTKQAIEHFLMDCQTNVPPDQPRKRFATEDQDSSMASDASSGPERPFPGPFSFEAQACSFTHLSRSKRCLEAASTDENSLSSYRSKLRKLQSTEYRLTLHAALEDTASSPPLNPYVRILETLGTFG